MAVVENLTACLRAFVEGDWVNRDGRQLRHGQGLFVDSAEEQVHTLLQPLHHARSCVEDFSLHVRLLTDGLTLWFAHAELRGGVGQRYDARQGHVQICELC